jgi:hypothetical protein
MNETKNTILYHGQKITLNTNIDNFGDVEFFVNGELIVTATSKQAAIKFAKNVIDHK